MGIFMPVVYLEAIVEIILIIVGIFLSQKSESKLPRNIFITLALLFIFEWLWLYLGPE